MKNINLLTHPSLLDGAYLSRMRRTPGATLFGYREDPNDPSHIIAVPDELEHLAQGIRHLQQGFSLEKVATWLHAKTGRSISPQGLLKRRRREEALQRKRRLVTSAEDLDGKAPALTPLAE